MQPTAIPPKPTRPGRLGFFQRCVWEYLFGGRFPIKGMGGISVEYTDSTYWIKGSIRSAGAPSGWFWTKDKRLYAPLANGYAVNQIVKIRSSDSMATTGIVCTGAVTQKATAGIFVALQTVPKLKNDGTDNPAHIPQWPLPSGDDDPDNVSNFWELVRADVNCI